MVMMGRGTSMPAWMGAFLRPIRPIMSSCQIRTATMIWSKACLQICNATDIFVVVCLGHIGLGQ